MSEHATDEVAKTVDKAPALYAKMMQEISFRRSVQVMVSCSLQDKPECFCNNRLVRLSLHPHKLVKRIRGEDALESIYRVVLVVEAALSCAITDGSETSWP